MDRRSAAPRSAAKPCGSASRFSSPGLCAGSLPRGAHESFGPCSLLLPPRTGRGATYACAAAALTFAGWSAARPSVSPPGKAVAEVVPPVGSVGVDDRPLAVMSSPIQPKREPYEQKAVLSLLPGALLRDGTPSLEPMASLPRSSGSDAARVPKPSSRDGRRRRTRARSVQGGIARETRPAPGIAADAGRGAREIPAGLGVGDGVQRSAAQAPVVPAFALPLATIAALQRCTGRAQQHARALCRRRRSSERPFHQAAAAAAPMIAASRSRAGPTWRRRSPACAAGRGREPASSRCLFRNADRKRAYLALPPPSRKSRARGATPGGARAHTAPPASPHSRASVRPAGRRRLPRPGRWGGGWGRRVRAPRARAKTHPLKSSGFRPNARRGVLRARGGGATSAPPAAGGPLGAGAPPRRPARPGAHARRSPAAARPARVARPAPPAPAALASSPPPRRARARDARAPAAQRARRPAAVRARRLAPRAHRPPSHRHCGSHESPAEGEAATGLPSGEACAASPCATPPAHSHTPRHRDHSGLAAAVINR